MHQQNGGSALTAAAAALQRTTSTVNGTPTARSERSAHKPASLTTAEVSTKETNNNANECINCKTMSVEMNELKSEMAILKELIENRMNQIELKMDALSASLHKNDTDTAVVMDAIE